MCAILVVACKGNDGSIGAGVLGEEDQIIVGRDTFPTSSALAIAHDIYTTPDSFLLGECDSRFGTLHADVLAQFTCPLNFQYPATAEVDSVCLFFYYRSWFGDGNTPMSLAVYEMDKKTLDYSTPYSHTVNVEDYVTIAEDKNILARQRFLVANRPTDSVYNSATGSYIPFVRLKLSNDFAQRLFAAKDFSNQDSFNQAFKGLYIESDFGSATLLHITDINLALYYHFSYDKAGRDTTVYDVKGYYANSEVRQVNRYIYINEDLEDLTSNTTINYVVSPAGMYTRVSLPIREITTTILDSMRYTTTRGDVKYRRPYINKAALTFEVLNAEKPENPKRDDWAQPAPNMLLIREASVDRFFSKHELPSDTCAILSSLTTFIDSDLKTKGYYSYSIINLLAEYIRSVETQLDTLGLTSIDTPVETLLQTHAIQVPDTLNMLLVPVSVGSSSNQTSSYYGYYYGSSSSATVTSVKHEQIVTATVLRSAQSDADPLSIEVVYSGF